MSEKSQPTTREELKNKIREQNRARGNLGPVYIDEPGLGTTGSLIFHYKRLVRWNPEHERTTSLGELLESSYGVDLEELHRQIAEIDAERAKKLLGTGDKPRRLS